MPEAVLYGIENCDQVRRARHWLDAAGVRYRFHDFRRDGLTREMLERWLSHVPWDALLNRRGQAWRRLDAERRAQVVDQASAIEALLASPLLVKRPVVEAGARLLIGFSEPVFQSAFAASSE
jgi:arsenate reductase